MYADVGINIYNKRNCQISMHRLRSNDYDYQQEEDDKFLYGETLEQLLSIHREYLDERDTVKAQRFKVHLPCNGQRTQTNASIARILRLPERIEKKAEKKHRVKKEKGFVKRRRFRGFRKKN